VSEENINAEGEELNQTPQPGEGERSEAAEAATPPEPAEANGESEAEQPIDPLSEAMNTITSLEDQLARSNADNYNLRQEYNGFVRRSKQDGANRYEEGIAHVIESLLAVLDDIALARQHGDLEGPAGQIAEKLEQTLKVNFNVDRFGAEGDEFDPQVHEALMHQTSPDVTIEKVNVLIQPGYKVGEKLLRAARVGVISPA